MCRMILYFYLVLIQKCQSNYWGFWAMPPIDLLPPSLTSFSLTGLFGRNQFVTTPFAAPALDQDFLHAQPTHRQHQYPIQNPVGPILPDFSPTFWTGGRCCWMSWLFRLLGALWFWPWGLINQHGRQGLRHLIQIVAQGAFWHVGLTRRLSYIDLPECNSDRFDFFVDLTYPISYGAVSW